MKKKIFALLTALCMTAAVLPAVFADGEEGDLTIGSTQEQCSCVVLCTEDNKTLTVRSARQKVQTCPPARERRSCPCC